MKKKRNQCYLFLGTLIVLLVACLCSSVFVKGNLEQAAKKNSFESIYVNTTIDYIVPGPSYSQVDELENTSGNGINTVTPYYETTTSVGIGGRSINGTSILFPIKPGPVCRPSNSAQILHILANTCYFLSF